MARDGKDHPRPPGKPVARRPVGPTSCQAWSSKQWRAYGMKTGSSNSPSLLDMPLGAVWRLLTRSLRINGNHERLLRYPHAFFGRRLRIRHRPEGVVGGQGTRPAHHHQGMRVLPVHTPPSHRGVPRERERQAPRRLAADRLPAVRPHVEDPHPRAHPRAGTRTQAAADVRERRSGDGATGDDGRGARRQERVPTRLERHLGAGHRHAVPRPTRSCGSVVRGMVDSGRIRLPMAVDAKVREDFTFSARLYDR